MCLSPVKIKNPKLNWSPNQPKYLIVPCGHCAVCRAKRQQEWFIRGYFEYMNIKKQGGNVFAACLTYNNQNLPHYVDKRDFEYYTKIDGSIGTRKVVEYNYEYGDSPSDDVITRKVEINCEFDGFDQDAIVRFMKSFRERFQRKYHFDPRGIKFFIASEFGEHTHRPHYHIIVYIPVSSFSDGEFYDLCDHCWKYGYVSKDKKRSWKVQSYSAIQYATKYVTKDLYFFDKHIKEYLDKEHLDPAEYQYRYERVKNYLPKFRASQHFGENLAKEIMQMDDPVAYLLEDKPVIIPKRNGQIRQFTVPKYILNKVLKYKDEKVSELLGRTYYRSTQLGKEYIRQRFEKSIEKQVLELKDTSFADLVCKLSDADCHLDEFKKTYICTMLSDSLSKLNKKWFVIYKNFLRYLPVNGYRNASPVCVFHKYEDIIDRFFGDENIPWEVYSAIREQSLSIADYDYNPDAQIGLSLKEMEDEKDIEVFAEQYKFSDYEHAARYLDEYNILLSNCRTKIAKDREDKITSTRHAFSEYQDFGRFDENGNKY